VETIVSRMLQRMCRWMWDCAPTIIPALVRSRGAAGSAWWFVRNMARYLITLRVLGALRTHLACVAISLHNDCTYCAYGHAHALELIYFRDRGRLFPVDAATLARWQGLPPRRLAEQLRTVLEDAGLHAEALWVDRILGLATGAQQPVGGTEARLAHLVVMVGTMNAAAMDCAVVPGEAMDTVNKDAAVKARHAAALAAAA
jgi:hypothetical protein